MLALAITCWVLGVWAMWEDQGTEFWGWMLASVLFALAAY